MPGGVGGARSAMIGPYPDWALRSRPAALTERKADWGATREHGASTDAAGGSKVSSHLTSGQRALIEVELVRRQHELDRQVAEHQGGLSRAGWHSSRA